MSPTGRSAAAGTADAAGKAGGKLELRDINPPSGSAATPLVLKNAGPMSTEDVARGAAHELAKKQGGETNGQRPNPSQPKTQGGTQNNSETMSNASVKTPAQNLALEPVSSGDAVLEFQAAPSGPGPASNAGVVTDGAQSKSPLKRVHGDLYGATGGAGQAVSGSVGATSKSGKTSIYIQSDEARAKVGQPQP